MISPSTNALQDTYNGFEEFICVQHKWSDKMSIVFEVKIQCDTPVVQPVIWQYFITEMKPAINTNANILNLNGRK